MVPYAPGGSVDILGRLLAAKLSENLGQQVVVENRPGAAVMIAANLIKNAAPDGYSLIMGNNSTHGSNPALYAKLPFDPFREFMPVCLLVKQTQLMVAHPSVGVRTRANNANHCKRPPGRASPGRPTARPSARATASTAACACRSAPPASTSATGSSWTAAGELLALEPAIALSAGGAIAAGLGLAGGVALVAGLARSRDGAGSPQLLAGLVEQHHAAAAVDDGDAVGEAFQQGVEITDVLLRGGGLAETLPHALPLLAFAAAMISPSEEPGLP